MDEANFDWTSVVAEQLIRDAIESGVFDNLPGNGKPIPEEILSTPVYQRIANRALQEAKVLPEWMELEREIFSETGKIDEARARLLKAIRMSRDNATRMRFAERLRSLQKERMNLINTLVLKYNYNVPAAVQKPFRTYNVTGELKGLEFEIEAATRTASTDVPEVSTGVSRSTRRKRMAV